jgi:PAS domain S-box-containing protein
MARRIRSFDWANHPLGAFDEWPPHLRTVLRTMLSSRYAMWLGWGPDLHFFWNDAYLPTIGDKERWALGAPARQVWEEIWPEIGPRAEWVVRTGEATWDESLLLFLARNGMREETYHTFSYSPVTDDDGAIGGLLCVVTEDTERVVGERRLALLHELGADIAAARSEQELLSVVTERLELRPGDLPFALVYLFEGRSQEAAAETSSEPVASACAPVARLACAHGVPRGDALAPEQIQPASPAAAWPIHAALTQRRPLLVDRIMERFSIVPTGPWDRPAEHAWLVPLAQHGEQQPAGVLIAALNPYRPFDPAYRGFVDLLAAQIASGLSAVRAAEADQRRAEAVIKLRAEAERRQRELERQSEERFRTLARHAPVGIFLSDRNGNCMYVNERWCEMAGLNPEQALGRGWLRAVHPDDRKRVSGGWESAVEGGRTSYAEFRFLRTDGTTTWLQGSAVRFLDADGEVGGYVGTLSDITSRRQAELELQRARDEALAASRAKDEFLATLSHELRTPLNPVLLLASDAVENPSFPAEVRALFEVIRANVSLEARLIDDLLDVTRITRGKLTLDRRVLDVHEVLREALAIVQAEIAEKKLDVRLELAAPRPHVEADTVRLQQVFWNVLKNAIKFTPAGGSICIQTSTTSNDTSLRVRISDTGIGLRPEELGGIFEAFAQGRHQLGGLGLGLAISRMLVESHGGRITAESPGPGRGSTFCIELPGVSVVAEPIAGYRPNDTAPSQPAPPTVPCQSGGTARARVLLVEDHAATRTTLSQLLHHRRFEVLVAANVSEARVLARATPPDFVISDIGLPDGDGCELLAELRTRQPGLRGIALSGYGMEDDLMRTAAVGFSEHLIKPVDVHALENAVERVLGSSR